MGKGRRYDQDYKDMIVDLFKSGMSVSEISSEYGIPKSTINGWIKDVKEIKVDENEVMTLKEVKELKKEMQELRRHNINGASRIHKMLSMEGFYVSLKRVQRKMSKLGLCAVTVKNTSLIQAKKL